MAREMGEGRGGAERGFAQKIGVFLRKGNTFCRIRLVLACWFVNIYFTLGEQGEKGRVAS